MDGGEIETQTVFAFDFEGEDSEGFLNGTFNPRPIVPAFLEKARYFGLDKKLLKLLGTYQ
jgi:pilus assembly protein CpaF